MRSLLIFSQIASKEILNDGEAQRRAAVRFAAQS